MKDNAKDVCVEEAKCKEKIAKVALELQRKPSDSEARKVVEAKSKPRRRGQGKG